MKKLLLITIILLLQSFPSFGNPNGKGLICKYIEGEFVLPIPNLHMKIDKNGKKIPSEMGYFLNEDMVTPYFFRRNNDDIELIGLNSPQYTFTTTNKTVEWGDTLLRHILDRKTLLLKVIRKTKVVSNYKCEVTDGKEVFIIQMKKIRYIYRSEVKEKLKKLENKI